LGIFGSALDLAASVTEKNLSTQQALGQSGANFAGSLTAMRSAAAQSYLSLDQFATAVAKNSDIFRTLGGNVQDGANQFARIQRTLLAPGTDTAAMLATMGISAQDAADLTASYMRSQGSMNKQNLQDSKRVAESVANYASELTLLSQITGKSRKELQEKLDAENAEAQWEAMLATMSPEKAEKMRQGMQTALAQGGQGAVDAFKAMAMGLPPMTEAGRLYIATQEAGAASLDRIHQAAIDDSISTAKAQQINRESLAKAITQGAGDMDKMRTVLQAGGLTGSALANTLAAAQKLQTSFMKDGKMMSEKEIVAKLAAMDADNKTKKTEAETAQKQQRAWQDLTNKILTAVSPALTFFLGVISRITTALGPAFENLSRVFSGIITDAEGPIKRFTDFIEKTIVPNLSSFVTWIGGVLKDLSKTSSMNEFFSVLLSKAREAFGYLRDNIFKPLWKEVLPDVIKMFKAFQTDVLIPFWSDIKPPVLKFFSELFDDMMIKLAEGINQMVGKQLFDVKAMQEKQVAAKNPDFENFQKFLQERSIATGAPQFSREVQLQAFANVLAKREGSLLSEFSTWKEKNRPVAPATSTPAQPEPIKRAGGSLSATGKLIENFGSGTPAVLHGKEGVVTEDQMSQIISGASQLGQRPGGSNGTTEGLEKITAMLSSALQQLAVLMKENNEYTKRNLDATRELGGNLWAS
jgi:hypothetical protein